MATAARLPFAAWRNELRTATIRFVGMDLTGKALRGQVRLRPNTPGAPLINLAQVDSAAAEGLKLESVVVENGVPVSTVYLRLNKTTMSDAAKVPYSGEMGDDTELAYALQIDGITRVYGPFVAVASPIDSENAPLGGYSGSPGRTQQVAVWSSAQLTFGDEVITVAIDGIEQLAPLVSAAATSATAAAASQAQAGSHVQAAAAHEAAAALAAQSANDALAQVSLAGIYATKAAATAALASIPADAYVQVLTDESQASHRTLYSKTNGALVLRHDFANGIFAKIDVTPPPLNAQGGSYAKLINIPGVAGAMNSAGGSDGYSASFSRGAVKQTNGPPGHGTYWNNVFGLFHNATAEGTPEVLGAAMPSIRLEHKFAVNGVFVSEPIIAQRFADTGNEYRYDYGLMPWLEAEAHHSFRRLGVRKLVLADWDGTEKIVLDAGTNQFAFRSGVTQLFETLGAPFAYQNVTGNTQALPYLEANGTFFMPGNSRAEFDFRVGRNLTIGAGEGFPIATLGGAASTVVGLYFRAGGAGTGTLGGRLEYFGAGFVIDAADYTQFRSTGGATWAEVLSTGFNVPGGNDYRINNAVVLAGVGAAIADPAADVASLHTAVTAMLARMRAATPSIAA